MNRRLAAVGLAMGLMLSSSCSTSTTEGSSGQRSGEDCGYAFVHAAPIGSSLFERWAEEGVELAREELGTEIESVESATPGAIADNFRAFAQQGCKQVIATVSFPAAEPLTQVAREFPDQQFAIIDAEVDLPNVRSYTWAIEEGTYVTGVAAALMSETGVIGAVFGEEVPPLKRWESGYEQGANAADPTTTVLVNYVGSFSDPARALTLSIAQREQGADIILPASGSNLGIIAEAASNDFLVAGIDPEEASQGGQDGVAFTMYQDVSGSVRLLFGEDWGGELQGGVRNLRLEDGVFEFDPFNSSSGTYDSRVPEDVIEAAREAYDGIIAGEIVVDNPIAGQ